MEKISIIVPIYNVAPYLPACLDSIIHQTYLNLEIILVDDGSTDSSNKICEQYKTVDPRIQVIHQKNQESPLHEMPDWLLPQAIILLLQMLMTCLSHPCWLNV